MSNYSFSTHANRRGSRFNPGSRPNHFGGRPQHKGAYIHPDKFVNTATAHAPVADFVPQHAFSDFALSARLHSNIAAHGYTTPTAIQDDAIEPILNGKDLIGLADTGSGKTAAFIIPIIERLHANRRATALIIAPTRELAMQIDDEFKAFAVHLQLYSTICVGGANMQRQINGLRRGPAVVIGTPGRLRDLVEQGALRLSGTETLVLDEADRMLDMGFSKDLHFLVDLLPKTRQSLCFSATLTPDIERLVRQLLTDPITVSVKTSEGSDHVEQNVIKVDSKEQKMEVLSNLLRQPDFAKVLIFGQTKRGVQRLAENLTKQGVSATAIHGNKSLSQRIRALQSFKDNGVQVLVATDVAARGLDIPHVTHVINYDQPNSYEDYIHRIGRTGRAGNVGNALTFVTPN